MKLIIVWNISNLFILQFRLYVWDLFLYRPLDPPLYCAFEYKNKARTGRVVCPNLGHPALTSSFTKYNFFQIKTSFATFVNDLSVLKLLQFSMAIYIFVACLKQLQSAKPRMTKFGHTTLLSFCFEDCQGVEIDIGAPQREKTIPVPWLGLIS